MRGVWFPLCLLWTGCGEEIGRIGFGAIGETKEATVRVKGGEELHLRADLTIRRGGPRTSGTIDMRDCWRWEAELLQEEKQVGTLSCNAWYQGGTCSHGSDTPDEKVFESCTVKDCKFTPKQSGEMTVRARLVELQPCGYVVEKLALIVAK